MKVYLILESNLVSIMKKYLYFFVLFVLLVKNCQGQSIFNDEPTQKDPFYGTTAFVYNVYYFRSPVDYNQIRAKIYIGFSNDVIQFVKESPTSYHASYELVLAVMDKKENQIDSKMFTNDLVVSSFKETNSRAITNRMDYFFDLPEGKFKLTIELTDQDTRKVLHREKLINIRPFSLDNLAISDIIFSENVTDNLTNMVPALMNNFTDPNSNYGTYFEIYPVWLSDSLAIEYRITTGIEKTILFQKESLFVQKKVIPYIIILKDELKLNGRYDLNITVWQKHLKNNTTEKFSTSWHSVQVQNTEIQPIADIQQSISPLKTLLSTKDWNFLEQVNDSLKQNWVADYWKQRDPIPATEENELKNEFYKRVDFANANFTVNAADKYGWETDRGRIYIKYGAPTDVEQHVTELNIPPYEIWYYAPIERRFVFRDRLGFGDYELLKIE
jgi:GWxTD domain-containing protein